MNDIIKVKVFVFPNGETLWTDNLEHDHANQIMRNWGSMNPEYTECTSIVGLIKMPRNVYTSMCTTVEAAKLCGDIPINGGNGAATEDRGN